MTDEQKQYISLHLDLLKKALKDEDYVLYSYLTTEISMNHILKLWIQKN